MAPNQSGYFRRIGAMSPNWSANSPRTGAMPLGPAGLGMPERGVPGLPRMQVVQSPESMGLGFPGGDIVRISPAYQQPIRIAQRNWSTNEPSVVPGRWNDTAYQLEIGGGRRSLYPSYSPGVAQEPRIARKDALASVLSGQADTATVVDPALLGGSLNRWDRESPFVLAALDDQLPAGEVAVAFGLPVAAVERLRTAGKAGVPMTTAPGSVTRQISASDLGVDRDPSIAAAYEDILSEARRTNIYRDPLTMKYTGGDEVQIDPIDWGTGLPSNVPIPLRGRGGFAQEQNILLSGDAGGFTSQDPGSIAMRSQAPGGGSTPFGLVDVVWANGDGTYSVRKVDPTSAALQKTLDPDSTAPFGRSEDMSVGSAVQNAMNENQTKVMVRSALEDARQQGKFTPLPLGQRKGSLIGYLSSAQGGDAMPVYAPRDEKGRPILTAYPVAGGFKTEQVYRIGHPTNRNEEGVREALRDIPQLGVSEVVKPQVNRPVGLGRLLSKLGEGYEITSPGSPLFAGSPEALTVRLAALRGQAADPANPLASRLDVYKTGGEGETPLQSLVPEIAGGKYTGRVLPLARSESGPAALLSDALARIKGEEFGWQRAGLRERDVKLEGTAGSLGKGGFMQSSRVADGVREVIVPMILRGELTVEQIQGDPNLSRLFAPGSHARKMLQQEVAGASKGLTKLQFVDSTVESTPTRQPPRSRYLTPKENQPIQRVLFGSRQYSSGAEDPAEQLVAAAQTVAAQQRPSTSYRIGESAPMSTYEVNPYGAVQQAVAPLPVGDLRYTPSYVDDVAAYMARDARERGLAMPAAPVEAQSMTIPGLGLGEVSATLSEPIWTAGRPVGPYAGAPYYGTLDRSQYRSTLPGMRDFNYERLATALGEEPGSRANEAALAFLAERMRRRQGALAPVEAPPVPIQPALF